MIAAFQFDPTVTMGSVLTAVVFLAGTIGGWLAFRSRIDTVVTMLATRFEKHEAEDRQMFHAINTSIMQLVADTSRLIGRVEGDTQPPHARRRTD